MLAKMIEVKCTREENAAFHKVPVNSIVRMEFETYLKGVVPAEVGNAPLECAKAQAIAARTFAMPYVRKGDPITDQSSGHQAYRAPRAVDPAYARAQAGVEGTKGMVLTYDGKVLSTCSYSASNGGRTTSAEERWGGGRPWLIAKG